MSFIEQLGINLDAKGIEELFNVDSTLTDKNKNFHQKFQELLIKKDGHSFKEVLLSSIKLADECANNINEFIFYIFMSSSFIENLKYKEEKQKELLNILKEIRSAIEIENDDEDFIDDDEEDENTLTDKDFL